MCPLYWSLYQVLVLYTRQTFIAVTFTDGGRRSIRRHAHATDDRFVSSTVQLDADST